MSSRFEKNLFYAPFASECEVGSEIIISGQEAKHIIKVLRYRVGDEIVVANGKGVQALCTIQSAFKTELEVCIESLKVIQKPRIKKVIAFGAIKKRDRLEFALEKAVELGAWEICIFDADRSERNRMNEERLQAQVLSAFKQSCRFFLPKLIFLNSIEEVYSQYPAHDKLMAYVGDDVDTVKRDSLSSLENLLLVGPEGGFSEREVALSKTKKVQFIGLGPNRLRAETAVATFLSQFLFSE